MPFFVPVFFLPLQVQEALDAVSKDVAPRVASEGGVGAPSLASCPWMVRARQEAKKLQLEDSAVGALASNRIFTGCREGRTLNA